MKNGGDFREAIEDIKFTSVHATFARLFACLHKQLVPPGYLQELLPRGPPNCS